MTFRLTAAIQNIKGFFVYWISPTHESAQGMIQSAQGFSRRLAELVRAHEENQVLKSKIAQVSLLQDQLNQTFVEKERLLHLVNMRAQKDFATIPAVVVRRDPQNWTEAIWVNRGLEHSVHLDAAVLAVQGDPVQDERVVSGLVGRILDCSAMSSKVLLISDPLSSIAVTFPRSGEQGLLQGQGAFLVNVTYLNPIADVVAGDEIVTNGLGGVFPAGLRIGTVRKIIAPQSGFKRVEVEPAVSLSRIQDVLIIQK